MESWVEVTFELNDEKANHVEIKPIQTNNEKLDNENEVFLEENPKDIQTSSNNNNDHEPSLKSDILTSDTKNNAILEADKRRLVSSNSHSSILCIKANKNKDLINCPINRKMKNRIESEFWFQINDTG